MINGRLKIRGMKASVKILSFTWYFEDEERPLRYRLQLKNILEL